LALPPDSGEGIRVAGLKAQMRMRLVVMALRHAPKGKKKAAPVAGCGLFVMTGFDQWSLP